ncbi:MAG TPA: hypothetical protein VFS21_34405 [Roseiflexaceae bacterium]|nr:hypothetical protein [Roseiflexaceae bacterium]
MGIESICEVSEFTTEVDLVAAVSEEGDPSTAMVSLFLDAYRTLYGVVRPLWLELHFGYFSGPFPYLEESDVSNDLPVLYVQEQSPPAYTLRGVYGSTLPETRYVSVLSPEELVSLIAAYLEQHRNQSELFLSVSHLRVTDTHVKVAPESLRAPEQTFAIRNGKRLLNPLPEEIRDQMHWVAGPIEQFPDARPPIAYELLNNGHELKLKLYISWSHWRYPGHAEYEMVVQVLRQLVKQGWEAVQLPLTEQYLLRDLTQV